MGCHARHDVDTALYNHSHGDMLPISKFQLWMVKWMFFSCFLVRLGWWYTVSNKLVSKAEHLRANKTDRSTRILWRRKKSKK